jgi:hypothetical protein
VSVVDFAFVGRGELESVDRTSVTVTIKDGVCMHATQSVSQDFIKNLMLITNKSVYFTNYVTFTSFTSFTLEISKKNTANSISLLKFKQIKNVLY